MDIKPKILIIDDEEIVLNSCTQILKSENYIITTARNGNDGLEILREYQPDLVFVDLKMPGLSGFEVLDEILKYDSTIVTIVITGFATVSSAVEAMKKGTYDFLPKPFTPDELRLITQRGLERRRLVLETVSLRREKEMLREHFAAIVSHEIKSPLGALQQNLYALTDDLETKLDADQKARLSRLQNRINNLLELVNTWLRAISSDISVLKENFKEVSITSVIAKAIENNEIQAIRKNITLQSDIQKPLRNVLGDEGTLVEAVGNILGNAVKYTRSGGEVSIFVQEEDKDQIIISIVDNGIGISEEDLPHILEDFYVGSSKTSGERRSGVGLAITRRIIEIHEGSISVKSEPGSGSTFKVILPIMI